MREKKKKSATQIQISFCSVYNFFSVVVTFFFGKKRRYLCAIVRVVLRCVLVLIKKNQFNGILSFSTLVFFSTSTFNCSHIYYYFLVVDLLMLGVCTQHIE